MGTTGVLVDVVVKVEGGIAVTAGDGNGLLGCTFLRKRFAKDTEPFHQFR